MVLRLSNCSGEHEDLSHMLELPSCSHMQIGLPNDNWLFWQFYNETDNKCVVQLFPILMSYIRQEKSP